VQAAVYKLHVGRSMNVLLKRLVMKRVSNLFKDEINFSNKLVTHLGPLIVLCLSRANCSLISENKKLVVGRRL
jgi:hypothetical protein